MLDNFTRSFGFLKMLEFLFLNAFNWACNSHALTNEGFDCFSFHGWEFLLVSFSYFASRMLCFKLTCQWLD